MLQLLQSDTELYIDSDFVYLPLNSDPSIERELKKSSYGLGPGGSSSRRAPQLIEIQGKYFIRSLRIRSILDNYKRFDPETFEFLRRSVFNRFLNTLNPSSLSLDEKLRAIVFQVLPHFTRKKNKLRRRLGLEEEFLDLVSRQLTIPAGFQAQANTFSDTLSLNKALRNIAGVKAPEQPSPSGLSTSRAFRQWILKSIESRIIEEEKNRLGTLLQNRQQFSRLQRRFITVLLFIKARGALELNGCGFFRNGDTSEYYVYVRTGEYALKDFYGRIYLFPDCRVAISTLGPLVPYVLERYKHPFLKGYDTIQKICVRGDFVPSWKFTPSAAIQALEEGLNALFYGYNSRRGNGYQRLDSMKLEENSIIFDEFRIPDDDPRILSGEIEVKNDFY